ncbi:Bromo domain-containing protein [Heracleum sosnowskyi]|uniref:Bromo domain-containing protein n=1 Tax=Heracleum sosnowskyi TaxID=360622 RepID=A0AAD8HM19_9APIA|nr:Bromo domain-containing protein [Heracleum sosnowskyi]
MTTVSDSLPKLRLKIKFISKTTQDAKLVGSKSNSVKDGSRCVKRGPSGVEDAVLNKRQKMDCSSLKRDCGNILDALIKHPASYGFCEPVDPVKLNIPDYFSIISKPMDLGTVRTKLQKNMYLTGVEFKDDVKLTFSNAMLFNPPGNFFHKNAVTLDAIFNTKWKSQLKRESCQESCLTRELPEAKVTDNDVKISYARPPPARRRQNSRCPKRYLTSNTCKSDPESDVAVSALDEESNCSSPQPSSVCTTAASADACWTPAVDIIKPYIKYFSLVNVGQLCIYMLDWTRVS